MSELTQSVVVCNLDGRILLYNNRARVQFRALSDAPALADGAELIGLGPLDLRRVRPQARRPRAGERAAAPAARRGQPERAVRHHHARGPVAARADGAGARRVRRQTAVEARRRLSGFVLMLDNITRDFEQRVGARRAAARPDRRQPRRRWPTCRRRSRCSTTTGSTPTMRERFLAVVRDEARAMSRRINEPRQRRARRAWRRAGRWRRCSAPISCRPRSGASRRSAGCAPSAGEVDGALWLKLDSFSLLQALAYLALRLRDEFEIGAVRLRLQRRRRAAGAARPGLGRPGDEHRDRDELGDGPDRAPAPRAAR